MTMEGVTVIRRHTSLIIDNVCYVAYNEKPRPLADTVSTVFIIVYENCENFYDTIPRNILFNKLLNYVRGCI